MNRLFRYDRAIAWNTIRATFSGWQDRVIAAIMLLAALAVVRSWLIDRPPATAAWVALAAGIVTGFGAGRLVGARLAFHAFDGLLAADALHARKRRRYVAMWHGVGLVLLALVTLIGRPSLLIVGIPAYVAGALLSGLTHGFRMPRRIAGMPRPIWMMRAWSHRPVAGVAAATILLLSLPPARAIDPNALPAMIAVEAVLLALVLTTVDDGIVRFMAVAGHGSRRIVVHHAKGLASFLAVAAPGCWIMDGPVVVGMMVAAWAAMLLLLTLRVLAYRLHGKRFADLLVAVLAGLLILIAYSMPVALPAVALAMLWQLQRRGRTKTWLLA